MADDVAHSRPDELEVLLSMSTRIRAAQRVDPQEVECALEAGFGVLIALEAELSRMQSSARRAGAVQPAGAGDVIAQIEAMRDALTELRTVAVPPGQARIGYGFVLPGQHGRAHASRN